MKLMTLAATNCQIAAALRFIRVPVWQRVAGDSVQIADLRYGGLDGGGFADLTVPVQPERCPRFIPDWEPPRRDVLDGMAGDRRARGAPPTGFSHASGELP